MDTIGQYTHYFLFFGAMFFDSNVPLQMIFSLIGMLLIMIIIIIMTNIN